MHMTKITLPTDVKLSDKLAIIFQGKNQFLVVIKKSKRNNFGIYYERQYTTILLDKYVVFSYLSPFISIYCPSKRKKMYLKKLTRTVRVIRSRE